MDAQADLGLRCPHMSEDMFSHGKANKIYSTIFKFFQWSFDFVIHLFYSQCLSSLQQCVLAAWEVSCQMSIHRRSVTASHLHGSHFNTEILNHSCVYGLFVCVEVLRPSQPNGVMSSAVSLANRTFTGQA